LKDGRAYYEIQKELVKSYLEGLLPVTFWAIVNKRIAYHIEMKSRKYLNNIFCLTHPDEKLNLICAERHCPHRGLLCQLCKLDENESHLSHLEAIIPFKYFIESLEANLDDRDQQINSITEQSCLSRLQKLRDEMLVRLSLSVQEVARMVSELEERIMREYEASK
jgi:hypothetical protein